MSNEEKEAPTTGFAMRPLRGLSHAQRFLAEKRAKKAALKADTTHDADSELLERFAQDLAQELMATYPPEQIAEIAARHMIGADIFQRKEAKATEAITTAVDDYRTLISDKRAKKVTEKKAPVIKRAREIAVQKWQEDTEKKIRIRDMATVVYNTLNREGYNDQLPGDEERVMDWIRPVAPNEASRPGRPRKSSNS